MFNLFIFPAHKNKLGLLTG